jgi:hypothetical protein
MREVVVTIDEQGCIQNNGASTGTYVNLGDYREIKESKAEHTIKLVSLGLSTDDIIKLKATELL